jgi:hypothetical protein
VFETEAAGHWGEDSDMAHTAPMRNRFLEAIDRERAKILDTDSRRLLQIIDREHKLATTPRPSPDKAVSPQTPTPRASVSPERPSPYGGGERMTWSHSPERSDSLRAPGGNGLEPSGKATGERFSRGALAVPHRPSLPLHTRTNAPLDLSMHASLIRGWSPCTLPLTTLARPPRVTRWPEEH